MSSKRGSFIGAVLLITGSCIGAGMLALPISTGVAGFVPSLASFLLAWLFMTLTGLFLVEVNGWFSGRVNIITMATHSLGKWGKALSWILYLFLFYSLLVAYISGSGSLLSSATKFPPWLGSLFFTLLFGTMVYFGTHIVDWTNRLLMVGKIAAYLGLVFLGVRYIDPSLLWSMQPSFIAYSLPVLIVSFGYHNLIPVLSHYMKGDMKAVRSVILTGSFLALIVYLIWQVIVLGIVPLEGENGILSSLKQDREASQALAKILGSSFVSLAAQFLAFFAILTSFLAQALALVHFLSDGFKISHKEKEHVGMCLLALAPPLACAYLYPELFFKALGFAGGFCATILFGILPALMVWIGRYRKKTASSYQVMGGKPLLVAVLLFSLFIVSLQLSDMFGLSFFPKP